MPKKSRKMKERAAMRRAVVSQSLSDTSQVADDSRPTLAPTTRTYTPLTFDYTHIYNDLKRIALFAIFFFAVLIALSFVIK